MQYLPSKKIVALMIIIILVGGFWLFLNKNSNLKDKNLAGADALESIAFGGARPEYKDSDNDGLEDWEEELFGTDPQNPDSNENGIPDGEEFASIKKIAEIKPTDNILNYLNQISQNLYNDGQGTAFPEAVLEIPPDHYSISDLTIVETNEATIAGYILEILLVTKPYEESNEEGTMDILGRWLEESDPRDLEVLLSRGEHDRALANELISAPVPEELATLHLAYVNYMYNGGISLEEITLTKQNPQAGFFAAAKYANFQSKRSKTILALTNYYDTHILLFSTRIK